jgi:uncharacterized protein YggT (Ycf19 family)
MALVDIILNVAALLLWLNCRAARFEPSLRNPAAWLAGNLRRSQSSGLKPWHLLLILLSLLALRSLFYWQIGPPLHWTPRLRLGAITLSFRADLYAQALLFSALSFLLTLGIYYICLLFISMVNGAGAESDPFQKLIRTQLGIFDVMPWPLKLMMPLALSVALWCLISPLLSNRQIIPEVASNTHRLEQSLVIGLGAYLPLKFLIAGLLCLYLLNSYVYLGDLPFWSFINHTGGQLLRPLRMLPLRIGKLDFAPLVVLALVFLAASFAARELTNLYSRLPL